MTEQNVPRTADQILEQIKKELREKESDTKPIVADEAQFSEESEMISDDVTPEEVPSAADEDEKQKAARLALKWAVSRPMDEKGYTGAYERYHTNHGTVGSRLSEEKKQEIRERVSRTLAEGILLAGQTASFAKLTEDKNKETRKEQTPKTEFADIPSDDVPAVRSNDVEASEKPAAEEKETAAQAEKRGIVTGEGSNSGPFDYADFKMKRANAVKEFFNNMHDFTFTRTNQEAVEMLHMHQQTSTSFAESAENEDWSEEQRKKQEEAIYNDRVDNLRRIITGEKQMTLLRLLVTGGLGILSFAFFGLKADRSVLTWFGAEITGWIVALLQLLVLLAGGLMSINVYMGAIQLIKNRRIGKEILASVVYTAGLLMAFIALAVPSVFCKEYYTSYTALYLLTMFGYHLGMHLQMRRLYTQFEKTADEKSALTCSLEPLENRFLLQNLDPHRKDSSLVIKQVRADVIAGFEDHCFAPDWFDKLTKSFVIGLLVLSGISAIGAGILSGDFLKAIFVFTGTFGFCSPFAAMFAAELPMQRTVKDAAEQFDQFSILHADAVEDMADAGAVIVSGEEIFPPESVMLHGLRSAAGVRVDEAILDAVSILTAGKSVLAPTFLQMISDKAELLKPVDSITYEDGMGISAWVDNNRVLIGSRKMMENHNIRMPSQEIEQAESGKGRMILYLAKQGELIAVFSLSLHVLPQIKRLLGQARSQETRIYVRSVDCLIENNLLHLFGEDADIIGILPSRLHADYEKETNRSDAAQSLVISDGSLAAALHASMQLQRLRASLEINRLLVVVLTAVTGIFFAAASMAGTPGMIGAVACLIPMALHVAFGIPKR